MQTVREKTGNADGAVKRYPFRFSPLICFLLVLGVALCLVSFGLTTWYFTDFLKGNLSSPYEWLKYILLYGVSCAGAVLFLAMLIRSEYVLTAEKLRIRFGLIVSSYSLKSIRTVKHLRGSDKLAVYFERDKYMVIVVKPAWYEDFVKSLLERNPKIAFDFVTAEEEQNLRKK